MSRFPDVPTQLAFEVAAPLTRQQFNESVSRGYYKPRFTTTSGKARTFDDLDMFGLYVIGELLKLGFRLELAASRAAGARDALEGHPKARSIWISYGPDGDSVWVDGLPKGVQPQASIVFTVEAVFATLHKRVRSHARRLVVRVEDLVARVDKLEEEKTRRKPR